MTTIAAINVGTRGTVFIDDDGTYIRFYLSQSDGATFIGSPGKDWWGTVNGVAVGGKWTWASGGGTRLIAGPWHVGYTQSVNFGIGATGTQGFGGGGTTYGTAYRATVPQAPTMLQPDEVTPTSMRVRFSGNGDGGSPITSWALQRATDPGFTQNVATVGSNGTTYFTDLTPNTTYYYRARGGNAVGVSAWSGTAAQATLPATPPGLTVTPTIDGTGSSAAVTPPSGVTGVTKYTLQRRLAGTTTPVTSVDSTISPIVATRLTPGATYEYRASAWFGTTYQSPWSDWYAATQPNPNTDPGSYFDGNTPDTPALDYSWTGAANNSTSVAMGTPPAGWRDFAASSVVSGGTGVVFRAAGGFQGSYAARALFLTDTAAFGFEFGTANTPNSAKADVEPDQVYFGTVYAYPSRAQRLRASIVWWTEAGVLISVSTGVAALVEPAGQRLVVQATAPATAQRASIVVQDVSGPGGVTWKGGEWLQLDAAMISLQAIYDYFDGSTLDTALYRYDWLGAANASPSTRTTLQATETDPLADPDCPPPPAPPVAPTILDDCIDEVGTWRRYWAAIPASEISDHLQMIPTVRVTTGGFDAKQVRIRIYENPENLPSEIFDPSIWMSEQIISYMPPLTTMTLDGVDRRALASVNGAPNIAADKLLYGTGGTPPTWTTLSCGIGYLLSFDVPLEAPAGNVSIGIDLTRRVN